MHIMERGDPEERSHMELALEVGRALNEHYPNHPWIVGFQSGGIVIRHLVIAGAVAETIGREGFASLLPKDKLGTPKEVHRSAVEFGGQMLELFGMPRGAWHGKQPIVPVEWRYRQERNWA